MCFKVIFQHLEARWQATERHKDTNSVLQSKQKQPWGTLCTQNNDLLGSLEALGVLGDLELVDHILDRTIHEHREVVHRVVDTMVGNT